MAKFKKFKKQSNQGHYGGFGGAYNRGLGAFYGDAYGFDRYLSEIGRFNPIYCEPAIMRLMSRSVMPRLGLILLGSAMAERQYIVKGSDQQIESFHQSYIDYLVPQIVKTAPYAIWYGWQPYILEWRMVDGRMVPVRANDIDPFECDVLENEADNSFAGLRVRGEEFGLEQALKLTWQGHNNNHYGTPQALTVYPFWWAHSAALVWCLRYYERSVDPLRLGYARTKAIELEDGQKVDLSELVVEILDALDGGDSASLPLPDSPDDPEMVRIETIEMPDRADTWLKLLTYLEQKILVSILSMPAIGVSNAYGDLGGMDAKVAEKTNLRVLEYATEIVVEALNQVVANVHFFNDLPGLPPRVIGGSFKRDQEEKLLALFRDAMAGPVLDPSDNSKAYRLVDLVQWQQVAKSMNLPLHDISEVSELWDVIHQRSQSGKTPEAGRPREYAVNPEVDSGAEHGHESRPEERLDGKERAR
jgi:hypothetical protein